MPTFKSRKPRPGERLMPLSAGRYRRLFLGVAREIGEVDEAAGVAVSKADARHAFGWEVDPKPLGRRVVKPYVPLDGAYVTGLTDADVEELLVASEMRRHRLEELKARYERKVAEVEEAFQSAAADLQRRIDERGAS